MNPLLRIRTAGALLTLCLAPGCFSLSGGGEPEDIPLELERSGDTLRISWEGEKIHHLAVIRCDGEPMKNACGCNGALVWGLGPNETEKFDVVALEAPFIDSPLEYGVTPESDRKAYASRPLEKGRHYLVNARRVGPCDSSPENCQLTIASGCQSFVW